MKILSLFILSFIILTSSILHAKQPASSHTNELHKPSYNLGIIAAFSEVVGLGIKKFAFSATLTPKEADGIEAEAARIIKSDNTKIYREDVLIITKLFPKNLAKDLVVFIIYTNNDIDEYLALKKKKKQLEKLNKYNDIAQLEIAYSLGKLLSYSDDKINLLIAQNKNL